MPYFSPPSVGLRDMLMAPPMPTYPSQTSQLTEQLDKLRQRMESENDPLMGLQQMLLSLSGGGAGAGGVGGVGGVGGGNPYGGPIVGGGPPRELALDIGRWIDHLPGFTVGGLEGYGGMGQISTGHVPNSQHYSGMAGDVSYIGGGKFNGEMAALDWLEQALQRRYGADNLTELIWREPNHWDHLHFGTRPGG